MFTQFITFAIIVAIIGCIMYGRKLIRLKKLMQYLETLKELKEVLTGLLLEVVSFYLHGFIIHGILLNRFILNQLTNYVKLEK
jgi:hypothetical protein